MVGTFEEEKDDDDDEVCETQSCEKKGIAHMRARNTDQINHTRRGVVCRVVFWKNGERIGRRRRQECHTIHARRERAWQQGNVSLSTTFFISNEIVWGGETSLKRRVWGVGGWVGGVGGGGGGVF